MKTENLITALSIFKSQNCNDDFYVMTPASRVVHIEKINAIDTVIDMLTFEMHFGQEEIKLP